MSGEECAPVDSLNELEILVRSPPSWARLTTTISPRCPAQANDQLYVDGHACHLPPSPPKPRSDNTNKLPRTLVCHDMKNGYQDDRFVNGSNDHSAYLLYHWAAIDIFIYFSHHFITIPPLGWINVAHKHGVQILGTIITEWTEGFKICEEFLETEEKMHTFTNQLVSVAKYFKLDGWFLNIENKVSKVQDLIQFLKYLTKEMHENIPGSVVLWYDSVTNTGVLSWQNCLNNNNKDFFDACDGIFTNYSWNLTHLENTKIAAGDRKHDVYFGADVWGRNFWGGGCFNTAEAVKEIHKCGFSLALFAPAWTHEAIEFSDIFKYAKNMIDPKVCADEKNYGSFDMKCALRSYFILRENAFWNTLWPYLNTSGPTVLPFHSFFCLGSGEKKRLNGKVIDDKAWFNLREQQYQLSIPHCSVNFILEEETATASGDDRDKRDIKDADIEKDCTCQEVVQLETATTQSKTKKNPIVKKFNVRPHDIQRGCSLHYTEDSFYGGNCIKICPLKLKGQHENDIKRRAAVRLFICDFKCQHSFVVYYIIKRLDKPEQDLNLLLSMQDNHSGRYFDVVLCGENFPSTNDSENSTILHPIDFENAKYKNLKLNLTLYYPSFYISDNDSDWEIRYYHVKFPRSSIVSINCELTNDEGAILVGGLGITKDIPLF